MSQALARRLGALEDKIAPKAPPYLKHLMQSPPFAEMLASHGVTVEAFQRNGLGALPRDLLRALVDRLKVAAITAG